MSDYSELKRLAEAQPLTEWKVSTGYESCRDGDMMYTVDGVESVGDYEDWGFTKSSADYIASANPTTVLALIAENEKFLKMLGRMVDQYVPLTDLEGMPGYSRVVELVEVVAERDALKAEVAGLKTGYAAYEDEVKGLRAEVEALCKDKSEPCDGCFMVEAETLRKDAERYRYMRKCSCEFRSSLPNHEPVSETEYDAECDAGMSKEASNG